MAMVLPLKEHGSCLISLPIAAVLKIYSTGIADTSIQCSSRPVQNDPKRVLTPRRDEEVISGFYQQTASKLLIIAGAGQLLVTSG